MEQSTPVQDIFVIDDASTDKSADLAESAGVRVIRHNKNLGRGAVRAEAIRNAQHELVLGCDAGVGLAPDFVERCLSWMVDDTVAAVQGRILQSQSSATSDRWRGRHLFKLRVPMQVARRTSHATTAAMVRKSVVLQLGNYREDMRAGEDKDLGDRLLQGGHDVVFDPSIQMFELAHDSIPQVLERYWRWQSGGCSDIDFRHYLRLLAYSLKVMVVEDIQDGDLMSIPISLLCPHYQFWRSWNQMHKRRAG